MKKAVLSRSYGKFSTTSKFIGLNGDQKLFELVAIELPDLGNQHDISCIPEGVYECTKYQRPDNKKWTYLLKDVKGREGILIHSGNYAAGARKDTLGCILPGKYFMDLNMDGNLDVAESGVAMDKIFETMGDKFTLYII